MCVCQVDTNKLTYLLTYLVPNSININIMAQEIITQYSKTQQTDE